MKKLALALTVLAVGTVSASAADLAARPYTKAPAPVVAPIYDWSGFYIGANGGGGWSHKCWDNATFTSTLGTTFVLGNEGCHDASGAVAGGQIGYRWQSSAWVFGLEAQGDWADLTGSRVSDVVFLRTLGDVTNRSKIDAIGLFTGQVGYAWNNVLFYVKGGAAVTRDVYEDFSSVIGGVIGARATETRWGGTVGAGLEFGFASNWSLGVEYDHLFMGTRTLGLTAVVPFNVNQFAVAAGGVAVTDRIRQDVDMFTVRLNYRFGGPIIAKY